MLSLLLSFDKAEGNNGGIIMDINATIAKELEIRKEQVDATVKLIDEGNTIPFIARYRKEMTGGLSDEQLNKIEDQIQRESVPYVYDTKEYPVEVIVSKYEKEQIFVPHYQRNYVWKKEEKSRFIESVFLGVPIMPFLVSVSGDEAELEIIDGSQRIRTLVEYCKDGFKLSGLKKLTELNGTVFSELTESRKNKFKL